MPGCSNHSNRERNLSYFKLLLTRKAVLKQWIHVIGRKNLRINNSTRVCSMHFVDVNEQYPRKDAIPSLNLPVLSMTVKNQL